MAATKGTANNTLKGMEVRQTELERLTAEGAQAAQQILNAFTTPPALETVDVDKAYAPLVQDIQNQPAPQDLPVPSAPSGLSLLAGLFGGQMESYVNPRSNAQAQSLELASNRIANREQIERANAQQRNQADAIRSAQLLQVREQILTTKLQQEIEGKKATQADKTAKELFVVKTALEHASSRLEAKERASMTREQLAAQERIAKMGGLFDFLSRLPRELTSGASASGGLSPEAESAEINKLVDFTTQIDLRIQPDKGILGFGAKKPSDEEMSAFMRTSSAYLSSPSQRVRQSALYFIQGALQDRFGDNQQKKMDFLQKNGLVVLSPVAAAPAAAASVSASAGPSVQPDGTTVTPAPAVAAPTGAPAESTAPFQSVQPIPRATPTNRAIAPDIAEQSRQLLRENLGR